MPLTIHDKPNTELFHELSRELISAGNSFRFRALGASMTPTIRDGEVLRVERVRTEELKRGDIVLFREGGNFRAHRLVRLDFEKDVFVTRGDATGGDDQPITASQILGRVEAKHTEKVRCGISENRFAKIRRLYARARRVQSQIFGEISPSQKKPRQRTLLTKRSAFTRLPFFAALFVFFALLQAAQAQVVIGNAMSASADVNRNALTITTGAITPAGTNRLLLVGISIDINNNTAVTATGVTFNGTALTRLGFQNDSANDHRIEMWYLLNPNAAAHTVVATFSNPGGGFLNPTQIGATVGVIAFSNVNQTTPFGTFVSAQSGTASAGSSLNVASGPNQLVVDTLAIDGTRTANAGAGQTGRWNRASGNTAGTDVYGFGSTEPGESTVTMSETFTGGTSEWAQGAVSIIPATVPTVTIPATVAGTNNVLIVGISMNISGNTSATVAGVTYNGVALTLAGTHNDAGNTRRVEIWYLVAPAVGTNNVVATIDLLGGAAVGTTVGATNVSGADQTSPIRDFISADGSAAAISTLNVPSANGDTVVDTLAIAGTDSVTAYGPTQTQAWASASGATATDVYGSGSTRAGAPSVPLSETFTANSNWSLAAVSVRPFQADLAISVSGNSVSFPANVTYSILVVNNGPTAATGVTMTDTLPAGLTFSSVTGTGCSNVGSAITCNIGTLASGANSSISIVATPSAGGGYPDTASVTGTITDLDTGNNSAIGIAYSQLNVCTVPASPAATALTGVINTYYPGTASVAAGATSITLGATTGATPIASGDEILIIQMQDAAISSNNDGTYGDGSTGSGWTNLNNAGIYEFATATSALPLGGGTLTVAGAGPGGGLLFGYNAAAATGAQGQRTFQVVRVPHYTTATLGTGLTASAWNGSTGGIFAVDTSGALTLAGQTVTVDGLGFRGGAGLQLDGGVAGSSTNDYRQLSPTTYPAGPNFTGVPVNGIDGSKGEGIAGTPMWLEVSNTPFSTGVDGYPNGSMGRGAPGNAGGGGTDANTANDQNSGGGGGANGGAGGFGGDAWNSNLSVGGLGGAPFPSSAGRVVMGGGGGAGSRNNSNNNTAGAPTRIAQASSGAAGGGIIIIRAGSITGTGTMSANGSDAYNLTSNDAGGGGGSGGTIIVLSNAIGGGVGTLTANAHGGRGGDAWDDDAAAGPPLADRHGPGGGGGGGVVLVSAAATINVSHGAHGTTLPAPGQYQYGATDGSDGTSATNIAYGSTPGPHVNASCTDVAVTKTAPATAFVGNTFAYTLNVTNNGIITATTVQLTDTLPAAVTFSSVTPTAICAQASGTVTCNIASLAAGASQPVTINVVAAATGTVTNTATVTESQADYDLVNNSASATTTITTSADVSITKTAPASVIEGTNFTYTLTVTNSGPSPATGVVVSDTLPSGVTYVSVTGTGCSQAGGTVTCNVGTLNAAPAAGSSATITITVQAGSPAKVTNTATVTSSVPDPNSANNTSSATTTITFPTSVRLETFTASSNSDGVLLAWKTGAEQHNLGFNVYREQNGQRVKLNPSLIAGSALIFRGGMFNQDVNGRTSRHSGKSYAWIDHTASSPGTWYWLEDIDVDGTHTMHGPVSVTQAGHSNDAKAILTAPTSSFVSQPAIAQAETMAQVNSSIAAAFPNLEGSHVKQKFWSRKTQGSSAQQIQFGLAAGPAVKILVDHEGWYRITQPQLVAAGLGSADPRTLQLFAEGVEQPISITGASNGSRGLGPGAAIEFYGTGIDTPYSGRRVYWLVNGNAAGKRIAETGAFGHSGPQPQSFEQTIELQQHTTYFAALLRSDTDNFFGALVSSTPVDQVLTVAGFAPGTGSATLEVALQGAPAGTTHDVQISFNGTNVGDLQFRGEDEGKISLDIPLGLLQNGNNTVTLTAQDGDTDLSLVDYLRLTYPHAYSADSDFLKCTAQAGDHLVLSGFTQSQVSLLDVTNPDSPVLVSAQVRNAGGSYTLDAQVPWSSSGTHTLLAVANDQIAQPVKLIANSPSTWHERQAGAEYVVISSSQFVNQAQALVQLHSRQGTSVALVTVEDLYDEFNFGERSPYAIRQFLKTATSVWRNKPKYLLLVGDASIDPRDFLGLGFFDFVPTALVPTAELKTASDDWFSDFNDTGYAQIATGRVAVRTADEAQLVISKIVNYETDRQAGSWRNQVVLVADQDDGPDTFTEQAQTLQSLLPSFMQATDIFVGNLGSTVAAQNLLTALNNGALLVNYNGHGSVEVWSPDNFMDDTIAASLTNGSHLPMFIIMNCLNGYFQDVYTQSLAESLMLVPNGGAVAVWASSGLTDATPQFQMDQLAVSNLFSNGVAIGDAVQAAKQGITDSDVRRTFILFGDPMMHLQLQPASNASSLHR